MSASTSQEAIRSYVQDADGAIDAEALVAALTSLAEEFRSPTDVAGYNLTDLVGWHLARAPAKARRSRTAFCCG